MNRCMRIFVNMPLLSLTSTVVAHQKPSTTIDGQSLLVTACQRAGRRLRLLLVAGGTGEISYPVLRNFSAVAEVAGHTTGHIPDFNTG